jgi:hypothetical protein
VGKGAKRPPFHPDAVADANDSGVICPTGNHLRDFRPAGLVRVSIGDRIRPREKSKFASGFNVFRAFKAQAENNSIAENRKSWFYGCHPASSRGTLRPIVTKREAGCGGRGRLASDECKPMRTAKACGPGLPMLRSSFARLAMSA